MRKVKIEGTETEGIEISRVELTNLMAETAASLAQELCEHDDAVGASVAFVLTTAMFSSKVLSRLFGEKESEEK